MSKATEGLTGLLGAYGSDIEDETGSGSLGGEPLTPAHCHHHAELKCSQHYKWATYVFQSPQIN